MAKGHIAFGKVS